MTKTLLAALAALGIMMRPPLPPSFGDDLAFLEKHARVVLLGRGDAQVAVCPAYQGRVMTSTASAAAGPSLGWIHREHIASGKLVPHINVFGGEDRFWLGPEGGQFSIFFKKGDPFDLEHWQTPAPIDSEPWQGTEARDAVRFRKPMRLVNYSGTPFELEVDLEVRLLGPEEVRRLLGVAPSGAVKAVAFQSENRITNTGKAAWRKATGLVSVWVLGMFPPAPHTTVVVPFRAGPAASLGPVVNDAYFGKVPKDRLVVGDGVLFFRADGQQRNKIGLSPRRAQATLGSYDADNRVLTVVQYTLPPGAADYVNSMWEVQKNPYGGDAVNSYNDGPPQPGAKPLGPFYELETSSPAAALAPGARVVHAHRTFHFVGPERDLDPVARVTLGVSLDEIRKALPAR